MSRLKPAVNAADHHQGNINAPLTLVEYGDFECPHCKHAHPFIKRLLDEMGKDLLFVYRNFPLRQIHQHAFDAAIAAEAAGKQGRFWEMHDLIFEHQEKLGEDLFMSLSEIIGLDTKQFESDLKDIEIQNKIEKDFESGIRSGVNATPTFFLNDSPVLTYTTTYKSLWEAVRLESELL